MTKMCHHLKDAIELHNIYLKWKNLFVLKKSGKCKIFWNKLAVNCYAVSQKNVLFWPGGLMTHFRQ